MSAICTRCQGTGFLNLHQVDPETLSRFESDEGTAQVIFDWMKAHGDKHDVQVCDCCGNGDEWTVEERGRHGWRDPHPYDCM